MVIYRRRSEVIVPKDGKMSFFDRAKQVAGEAAGKANGEGCASPTGVTAPALLAANKPPLTELAAGARTSREVVG